MNHTDDHFCPSCGVDYIQHTRLTKHESSLEKMANVPKGTYTRMYVLLASRPFYKTSDAFYEAMSADADAQQLFHFIMSRPLPDYGLLWRLH